MPRFIVVRPRVTFPPVKVTSDISTFHFLIVQKFIEVIKNHEKVLMALYKTTKNSVEFEKIYKEFEVKY